MRIQNLLGLVFLPLALSLSLSAQSGDYCIQGRFSQLPYFAESEVIKISDVTYGWAPRWPSTQVDTLKMDIYMPDPSVDPMKKRPFVLMIHGGAFYGGNKSDMSQICMDYARRGFVAATMSYRLGWDCNPPSPLFVCLLCGPEVDKLRVAAYRSVQDTRAAMRFVSSNAAAWGVDSTSFFVGGTSAGSVAAIHAVYLDQATANTFCPDCIPAVGPLDEGPNDIQAEYEVKGLLNNCGAVLQPEALGTNPDLPVLSFHDDGDCIVPSNIGWALGCLNCTSFFQGYGSQQIHKFADSLGTCSQLNLRLNSASHCSYPYNTVLSKSSCFMKQVLCGTCESSSSNDINEQASCEMLGDPVSSVLDPTAQDILRVYPNPSNGLTYVDILSSMGSEECLITVFDGAGRIAWQEQRGASTLHEVDLRQLPWGLYWVQVTGYGKPLVRKLVLAP